MKDDKDERRKELMEVRRKGEEGERRIIKNKEIKNREEEG